MNTKLLPTLGATSDPKLGPELKYCNFKKLAITFKKVIIIKFCTSSELLLCPCMSFYVLCTMQCMVLLYKTLLWYHTP